MSFTRQFVQSSIVFMLLGCVNATWAGEDSGDGAKPAEESASPSPVLPDLELASIDKFDSNALYLESVSADVAELERQAAAATDKSSQVKFLLAAANLVLAYEIEPACSRAVLHLPSKIDAPKIDGPMKKADQHLNQVQSVLDAQKAEADGLTEELRDSYSQLEQLQTFFNAIVAFLGDGETEDDNSKARQASSRLSILLEDDDERVVAAAILWHALLRSRHSDPERAARMLPLALSRPPQKSLPFGFYARVLRCRLLAKRGSYAVAVGLLSQLEEKSREWFVSEADQGNALRAITVTAFQVLDQWRARLSKPDEVEQRDWCVERMRWLSDRRLGVDNRFVLRLRPAVPIIAAAPEKSGNAEHASRDEQPVGVQKEPGDSSKAELVKDEPGKEKESKDEPGNDELNKDQIDTAAPVPPVADEPKDADKKDADKKPAEVDDQQRRP